jgi:GNAT superfamily N-acetyltransferase
MEPSMIDITLYRYGQLPDGFVQMLIDVHADAYADRLADPFVQRFGWFANHWSSMPGFTATVGYDQGEPIGYCYGAPATPGREWWRDTPYTPQGDDSSTYSVSELMVRPAWRKTGAAAQLHDTLLADRPERLAQLLVDPDHPKVEALYESWGYTRAGRHLPFADAPHYAVMVRDLHTARSLPA